MRNTKLCLIALFATSMIAMPFAATSVSRPLLRLSGQGVSRRR